MDLTERLDAMEAAIRKPSFRQSSGKANEVNYWIFDYPPEKELEVRERIEYMKHMSPLNARIADQNLSCKQEKSKVMKNLFWNCSAPTADLQKRNPHSGQKMFVTKLERWPRTI